MRKKNSTEIFSASYKKRLILSIGKYRGKYLRYFACSMEGHLWLRRKEKALNAAPYKPFPATPSWGPLCHLGGHYALRGWKGLSFEITSPLCSPLSVVSDGVRPSTSCSMNKGTCLCCLSQAALPLPALHPSSYSRRFLNTSGIVYCVITAWCKSGST